MLLVEDEEIDIRGLVGFAVYVAGERLEDSVEMRLDSVSGNFERKCGRALQVERFLKNSLSCAHRRERNQTRRRRVI